MKSLFKPLLLSALLAGSVGLATAQSPSASGAVQIAQAKGAHGHMDPAKMQERIAKRQAELKSMLNLSAAQQPAWAQYVEAMKPPADMAQRMSREERQKRREEMQALTTPQRIDRMQAMQAQRHAEMTRRAEAVKAFYAALDPDQQKMFDNQAMRRGDGKRQHGERGAGRHHG